MYKAVKHLKVHLLVINCYQFYILTIYCLLLMFYEFRNTGAACIFMLLGIIIKIVKDHVDRI